MHLTFVPDSEAPRFFMWPAARWASSRETTCQRLLAMAGTEKVRVVDAKLRVRRVSGHSIPLLDALAQLSSTSFERADALPASLASWSLAAKFALELISRQRFVPRLAKDQNGRHEARWAMALTLEDDAERFNRLAAAMPPASHALATASHGGADSGAEVWAPEALLSAFLHITIDTFVRSAAFENGLTSATSRPAKRRAKPSPVRWEMRLIEALLGADAEIELRGFAERSVAAEMSEWARPALGADSNEPRGCLRLDLPEAGSDEFVIRYFLQSSRDPSLLVDAADIWTSKSEALGQLGRDLAGGGAHDHMLRSLATAARFFPPIESSLAEPAPDRVVLDAGEAWGFLNEAAPALAQVGITVILPAELTAAGRRRIRMRMRVGSSTPAAGVVEKSSGLSMDGLAAFEWEAALGDEKISKRDLAALARLKAPLVKWRGQWVAVSRDEIDQARRFLAEGGGELDTTQAVAGALAGTVALPGVEGEVDVVADAAFAEALRRLKDAQGARSSRAPAGLTATLRPYQKRGLAWLGTMSDLGLGACLADDMGLGKTLQLLAFLLKRHKGQPDDRRPALVVCPTSVVSNWEREAARFAPSIPIICHHGPERAKEPENLSEPRGAPDAKAPKAPPPLVVTSYGLLRRDAEMLAKVDWSVVVLDEAQNIKNSASKTARAARSLRASQRLALTGTPVENRLAELWSILEFTTPGLLEPLEGFRQRYAIPIERYGDIDAETRLVSVVRPFILRRVKSDRSVIRDLPAKNEMSVVCSLTPEQAALYRAAVDDAMGDIEGAKGISRRGKVLALITALKQICNHPAQYLGEAGPLRGRSGKLARFLEMVDEALAEGDKALVFTQYREMGVRLVAELERSFGGEVLWLHGGVRTKARDEMIARFQDNGRGPRLFVLSLKAGGTGLNLTAASHVFHYDRWWNPAVEDQATDRAYRIGQTKNAQVHKLLTAGTVEEKIDLMLEEKRDLADRIVGSGERWITEMGDSELRDLFSLSGDTVIGDGNGGDSAGEKRCRSTRGSRPKAAKS